VDPTTALAEMDGLNYTGDSGMSAAMSTSPAATRESHTGSENPTMPEAGWSWVYAVHDRQYGRTTEIRVRASAVRGAEVLEEVTQRPDGNMSRYVDAGAVRIERLKLSADRTIVEFAPYLLASNGSIPAEIMKPEGYTKIVGEWRVSARAIGWERISLPRGTWRALRVVLEGRRTLPPGNLGGANRFSMTTWYAPESRRTIRSEHKVWNAAERQVGHDVIELISYQRPPG